MRFDRLLFLALALTACGPSSPAVPDAPTDGGADVAVLDTGAPDAGVASCLQGNVCGLVPSTGCMTSETCAYAHDGSARTNECISAGAGELGATCDDNTDCSANLSCIGGFCIELCCPTAGTCGATGTTCGTVELTVGKGTTDTVGLCVCTVGGAACPADHYCDPLDEGGTQGVCLLQGSCSRLEQDCPATQGCYGTIRECATAGTAAVGETCTNHSDCVPGAWCRAGAPSGTCSDYCDTSAPDCPTGFTCTSFGDDEPNVGGCYPE